MPAEAAVQPLAEASAAIEELDEEARRELERKYAFYRMLSATDRVLWRLEELNRDGHESVPDHWREQMLEEMHELPYVVLGAWPRSAATQEMLDGLLDLQERLFRWRDPQWAGDEGEGDLLDAR